MSIKQKLDEFLNANSSDSEYLSISKEKMIDIFGENFNDFFLSPNNENDFYGKLFFEEDGQWYYTNVGNMDIRYAFIVLNRPRRLYRLVDDKYFEQIYSQQKKLEHNLNVLTKITSSNKFRLKTLFK